MIINAHRRKKENQTDRQTEQLTDQIMIGVAATGIGNDRRGAEKHD